VVFERTGIAEVVDEGCFLRERASHAREALSVRARMSMRIAGDRELTRVRG